MAEVIHSEPLKAFKLYIYIAEIVSFRFVHEQKNHVFSSRDETIERTNVVEYVQSNPFQTFFSYIRSIGKNQITIILFSRDNQFLFLSVRLERILISIN